MSRTPGLFILAGLIAALAAGCGGKSTPARVTVVLFDLTATTNSGTIRQQYLKDFSKVLNESAGGVITADIIDDNPLAHSSFLINETFDAYQPLKENKLDYDRRTLQKRQAVLKEAEAVVRRRTSKRLGTNVLDALQAAERVFATYDDHAKLLVIFSDMIEQSKRYNFASESLTAARVGQIIARERSAGRLPELTGVEVCVVGAGATTSGSLSTERLTAIRDFWLKYFEAAGASLPKQRYGSSLLKCP
ncbi:MAG: hypothetical protein ACRDFA_12320 [bacterium]